MPDDTPKTYRWNDQVHPISGPDLSDYEVARRARMLMRQQLDHEAVCVLARDRIMHLSALVESLRGEIDDLESYQEIIAAEFEGEATIALRGIAIQFGYEVPGLEGWTVEDIREHFAEIKRAEDQVIALFQGQQAGVEKYGEHVGEATAFDDISVGMTVEIYRNAAGHTRVRKHPCRSN